MPKQLLRLMLLGAKATLALSVAFAQAVHAPQVVSQTTPEPQAIPETPSLTMFPHSNSSR